MILGRQPPSCLALSFAKYPPPPHFIFISSQCMCFHLCERCGKNSSLLLTKLHPSLKAQWVSQSVSDRSKVGVMQSSVVFQGSSGVFEMKQLMNGKEYLTPIYPSSLKKLACVSQKTNQGLKSNDIFRKLNKRSGKEKGKMCVL